MPTEPTLPGIAAALDELIAAKNHAIKVDISQPIPPTMTIGDAQDYAHANGLQFHVTSTVMNPDGTLLIKGAFTKGLAGMGDSLIGITTIVAG